MIRDSVSAVLIATLLWFPKDGKKISSLENPINVRIETFKGTYKPETDRNKISCAKILASMMLPCERVFLNKIRRIKFDAKIWMPLIEALPPNDLPLDFGLEICWQKLSVTLVEGGLSPTSFDVTYECEKHGGKYCMLLLLFFDCLFLLHFWHDLCINSCFDDYWIQYVFFFKLVLYVIWKWLKSKECDKMFNEVDDGEWDILDDDDVLSDSEKE